jgi:hypothetical protein
MWQPAPPPRTKERRSEIDCALSRITPKAAPVAPFGDAARQCHADADVENATAITAPANKGMQKRLMIGCPP